MSWAEDTKLRFHIFAIILTFMCPGFLIWMASDTLRQIESTRWPSVAGQVKEIVAKPWQNEKHETKYFGRVVYRYQVEGKDYTSDLTDLGPGAKRADELDALDDVAQYKPGMPVTVYYDPRDPSTAVIERGIPPIRLALILGLCAGTIVGAVVTFLTVRSWLRRRKKPTAQPASAAPADPAPVA